MQTKGLKRTLSKNESTIESKHIKETLKSSVYDESDGGSNDEESENDCENTSATTSEEENIDDEADFNNDENSIENISDADESIGDDDILKTSESDSPDASGEDESATNNMNSNMDDLSMGNACWADAISKVLRTNKPRSKKTLVLSRAKKLTDLASKPEPKDDGLSFEVEGEVKEEDEEKPDPSEIPITSKKERERKRKRREWENMCRLKPNILEKNREKSLSNIATRGVVQLFNAVQQQQIAIKKNLKAAGGSERKQEQVLRSVDKRAFLDVLMGPTHSVTVKHTTDGKEPVLKNDNEESDTKTPLWSVLRDDFLMGAGQLKDWDKAVTNSQGKSPGTDSSSEEEEET